MLRKETNTFFDDIKSRVKSLADQERVNQGIVDLIKRKTDATVFLANIGRSMRVNPPSRMADKLVEQPKYAR